MTSQTHSLIFSYGCCKCTVIRRSKNVFLECPFNYLVQESLTHLLQQLLKVLSYLVIDIVEIVSLAICF